MCKIMLRKLLAKKWMSICLLIGILLLIATAVSFPMYRKAAFDRMLSDEFRSYLSANGEWSTLNKIVLISKKDAGGKTMSRVEGLMGKNKGFVHLTKRKTYYN